MKTKYVLKISDRYKNTINCQQPNRRLSSLKKQIDKLFDRASFGTLVVDENFQCSSINNKALKWIGGSLEPLADGGVTTDIVHSENRRKLLHCIEYLRSNAVTDGCFEMNDLHGRVRKFSIKLNTLPFLDRKKFTYRVVFNDITEQCRQKKRQQVAAMTFDSSIGICVADQNDSILEVNEALSKMTGYGAEFLRGQKYELFFSSDGRSEVKNEIKKAIAVSGFWEGEIQGFKREGAKYAIWLNVTSVPMLDEPNRYHVICMYDITKNKATQEEIRKLAYFDSLTHLPNRRKLTDRLKRILSITLRSHLHGAVLFIDLDNFKYINDTKGHAAGDLLLIEVGQRLQKSVREGDMVARVGGDEFVVVLDSLSADIDEASRLANFIGKKIQEALAIPFRFDETLFNCGGSIGISLFSSGDSPEVVFQQADMAMYQAKREGRNSVCFFDPAMKKAANEYILLEQSLSRAIEKNQLRLFYQPQFNYKCEILAVEALLRWENPERGLLSADEFIPLAEESGLILPIGLWVLQKACDQINIWRNYPSLSNLKISINVSSRQFKEKNFVSDVIRILKSSGVDASKLKLELTESMMHDLDDVREKMETVREFGVEFSLDDFGTGFSSLASLIKLPLQQLKIDRSFVKNMLSSRGDTIIVKTIISMAKNLGVEVIAEGLETECEKDFLNSLGCSLYQGFLLSPPLPIESFERLMDRSIFSGNCEH